MPEEKKSKPSKTLPDKISEDKSAGVSPDKIRTATYKLITGLGNPGKEFENTYHNAGAMALSFFAKKRSDQEAPPKFKRKKLFEYAEENGVVLIKPLVFMNDSGRAIRTAAREFGVKPEAIAVIHDESDLPLGDFKISFGKNAGGHRGVQSIIDALQTKNFTRFRIGIRPKIEAQRKKAGMFVLKKITKKDEGTLRDVFEKINAEIIKEKKIGIEK